MDPDGTGFGRYGRALFVIENHSSRYGVSSWLEAAKSRLPVAVINTVFVFAWLLPSRARVPSTVTVSPTFMELRVQPALINCVGLASSHPQFATFPVSSVTSM